MNKKMTEKEKNSKRKEEADRQTLRQTYREKDNSKVLQ